MAQAMTELFAQVDAVVDAIDFGKAAAVKRGRNPNFPYVPVVKWVRNGFVERTTNPTQREAYATREEAIARAQAFIDAQRVNMRKCLKEPRYRAWRKQYGLPENI